MNGKIRYEFSARVWQHAAPGGWFFVSLPPETAKEIRENLKWQEEGWGRIKVLAKIGESQWQTAIWYDTKHKTYLLPVKAEIRKTEKIGIDNFVETNVWI